MASTDARAAEPEGTALPDRPRRPPHPGARPRSPLIFPTLLATAWLSAGPLPLIQAWTEAGRPNDFTADYVTALAWVREGRIGRPLPGVLDRKTANHYALSVGARAIPLLGPYYVHPPTALPALLPFTLLPYRAAAVAWAAVSVALLAVLAVLLAPLLAETGLRIHPAVLCLLLLLWPPVLTNFELGQWSIALATAMALAHHHWERGRTRRGAGWLAVATAIKLTPVMAFPFVASRDRRAALWFALVLAALVLAALPMGGVHLWLSLVRESGPNAANWQTFWHNGLSFNGLWSRLLVGGRFARPIVTAPGVARALVVLCDLTVLGVALAATRATQSVPPDRAREGCVLALWYIAVVVMNPLAWPHYALLLLLPALLAGRAASGRRGARRLVAAAIVLLSIPKETLYLMSPAQPAGPPRSLLLSLPLVGAILLFAGTAWIALGARPERDLEAATAEAEG